MLLNKPEEIDESGNRVKTIFIKIIQRWKVENQNRILFIGNMPKKLHAREFKKKKS